MSWKELYENYNELKDLTEEELIEKLGPWWGPIFFDCKDDIRKGLWRRSSEEAETEKHSCNENSCSI